MISISILNGRRGSLVFVNARSEGVVCRTLIFQQIKEILPPSTLLRFTQSWHMQMNQRYCRGLSRLPSLISGPSSVTLMPLLCGKTSMHERESSWCFSIVSWLGLKSRLYRERLECSGVWSPAKSGTSSSLRDGREPSQPYECPLWSEQEGAANKQHDSAGDNQQVQNNIANVLECTWGECDAVHPRSHRTAPLLRVLFPKRDLAIGDEPHVAACLGMQI